MYFSEILNSALPAVARSPRLADISGRRDDDFVYGSHTVPASAFRHVFGTDPRIAEYQVLQTERGADVLAVADASVQDMVATLVLAMQRYGVAHPAIASARSILWAATRPVANSSGSYTRASLTRYFGAFVGHGRVSSVLPGPDA